MNDGLAKVTVEYDLRLRNANGSHGHWSRTAAERKAARTQAWAELRRVMPSGIVFVAPITITLTRIARRRFDDDNLVGAMKATRDGVADWLHIDDGSPGLRWVYLHEAAGASGVHRVRIQIEGAAT